MLDQQYDTRLGEGHDQNFYYRGQIGSRAVVITCLPVGETGSDMAAVVAQGMMAKFPNIKIGLMAGIGGGLPHEEHDIKLGDVVVSKPEGIHGGVVQYDTGKYTTEGFLRTGFLNAPPRELWAVLQSMPAHGHRLTNNPSETYPREKLDQLYGADRKEVKRKPGCRAAGPHVFYGTIASGKALNKDPAKGGILIKEHGVLCCEMEATDLMKTTFPCLVIRGISDYADSYKKGNWQAYVAASAARYAKDFLSEIPQYFACVPELLSGMC